MSFSAVDNGKSMRFTRVFFPQQQVDWSPRPSYERNVKVFLVFFLLIDPFRVCWARARWRIRKVLIACEIKKNNLEHFLFHPNGLPQEFATFCCPRTFLYQTVSERSSGISIKIPIFAYTTFQFLTSKTQREVNLWTDGSVTKRDWNFERFFVIAKGKSAANFSRKVCLENRSKWFKAAAGGKSTWLIFSKHVEKRKNFFDFSLGFASKWNCSNVDWIIE